MPKVPELIISSTVIEIYKFLCLLSNEYYKLDLYQLMKMWCESQNISQSVFELMPGVYKACFRCEKHQFVDDIKNFHCAFCGHYEGPAQCIFSCCNT